MAGRAGSQRPSSSSAAVAFEIRLRNGEVSGLRHARGQGGYIATIDERHVPDVSEDDPDWHGTVSVSSDMALTWASSRRGEGSGSRPGFGSRWRPCLYLGQMADTRRDGGEEAPSTRRGGRATRLWLVLILVLAAGALAFIAFANGGHSDAPRESPPSPSGQQSSTHPAEVAASTAPSPSVPAKASASPTATASASVAPGLIAVVDDTGALFTLDGGGGSRASYSAPGVAFGFPAWSPDGSRIAVVGQATSETAIYVFNVRRTAGTASEPAVVYRSPDRPPFYLYWTPDSRHVSFLTTEPTAIALRVAAIDRATPLDGNDQRSVVRRGAPLYFQWVDAGRVLLHVGSGSDAFVGQVGLDGAAVGAPVVAKGAFRTANLSHDGRYLAYATSDTVTTGDIVVRATKGSTIRRLPAFGPAAMLFDPTGDALATIAAANAGAGVPALPLGPLRLINPVSGDVRTLLDGSVVAFFWAPDGRTIAAIHVVGPGGTPAAVLEDAVLTAVKVPERQATGVGAAPGTAVGLSFVDVSSGKVRSERVVQLSDPFVGQLLPYFDQYALSHQLWSSDSASIVLPLVAPSAQDQLAVIPADGSDPRPLANGSRGSWSP